MTYIYLFSLFFTYVRVINNMNLIISSYNVHKDVTAKHFLYFLFIRFENNTIHIHNLVKTHVENGLEESSRNWNKRQNPTEHIPVRSI